MIYEEIELQDLLDAQFVCRLWHANKLFRESLLPQRPEVKDAIEVLDPETFRDMGLNHLTSRLELVSLV